jgi:hypothetical protein
MIHYLLITSTVQFALRVVRRGHHFDVEEKRKRAGWEAIYSVPITQEFDAEISALRGALRKGLYIAAEYYPDNAKWILEAGPTDTGPPSPLKEVAILHAPDLKRDEVLNLRIPKATKARLVVRASELTTQTGKKHTVADVANLWLEIGGRYRSE